MIPDAAAPLASQQLKIFLTNYVSVPWLRAQVLATHNLLLQCLTHPIFYTRSDSGQELWACLSYFMVQERTGPWYTSRSPIEVDSMKEWMNEWMDTVPASTPVITCFFTLQVIGSSSAGGEVSFMILGPMSCFYTRSDRNVLGLGDGRPGHA